MRGQICDDNLIGGALSLSLTTQPRKVVGLDWLNVITQSTHIIYVKIEMIPPRHFQITPMGNTPILRSFYNYDDLLVTLGPLYNSIMTTHVYTIPTLDTQ